MMMKTLNCFSCRIDKPLTKYKDNNREYKVKWYKGKCMVCKLCDFQRTLNSLKATRYNFEDKKFYNIEFKDYAQVAEFFKNEGGEF